MSQLAASDGQPGNWEEPGFFLRRLETVRFQENGWQEPYESRGSRTDLRGTGGEIPPVYPAQYFRDIWFSVMKSEALLFIWS
jgi:hypothetical protein